MWDRGGQDLKWEEIATVLQADFLNYSRCGVSPCNSHTEGNIFVTEPGNCAENQASSLSLTPKIYFQVCAAQSKFCEVWNTAVVLPCKAVSFPSL